MACKLIETIRTVQATPLRWKRNGHGQRQVKVVRSSLSLKARSVSVRRRPLLRLAAELDPSRLPSNGSANSPRHPFQRAAPYRQRRRTKRL
ncbi:protein of unknown function [Nitrospira japonica]|uniref:Uncharacterized protein n=1 Tax=Nitrospira japonica TaxID=1325564 RepID=A0A1W1I0U7_9BACT|nr:protein of unknown function [Nitrospira japonica]